MKFALFFIFTMFLATFGVSASTYTPTDNLFDSSQANNLISMAYNQIDNFTSLDYVVFQVDNNYYLVAGKDAIVNNNTINFNQSTVISAVRTQSSYYGNYVYSTFNENSTSVNLNTIVISNIKEDHTVTSELFEDYRFQVDIRNVSIFILGLCFAIFLTKERRY